MWSGSTLQCEDNHIGHFDIVPAEPWTFDFITELSLLHLGPSPDFMILFYFNYINLSLNIPNNPAY